MSTLALAFATPVDVDLIAQWAVEGRKPREPDPEPLPPQPVRCRVCGRWDCTEHSTTEEERHAA